MFFHNLDIGNMDSDSISYKTARAIEYKSLRLMYLTRESICARDSFYFFVCAQLFFETVDPIVI